MTHVNSKTGGGTGGSGTGGSGTGGSGTGGGGTGKTKWRLPRERLLRKIQENNKREKNKREQQLYQMRLMANPSAKDKIQPLIDEEKKEEALNLAERIMRKQLEKIQNRDGQQISASKTSEDPPPFGCTEENKTAEVCMDADDQQLSASKDPSTLGCMEEKTTEACMEQPRSSIFNHISDLDQRIDFLLQQLIGNTDLVEPYIDPEIWSYFTSEKFQQEIDSFLTANLET
ncbi:unnamed protein product [Acanthosepion pharaonis]|uniref:Uncharacterized protein n=1 Tax=Acanthosepion pharaonis TaxID=158019 RepID=A0A812C5Q3_ACAPH|nr:unnamed protein product [Sepia pharaonis]